MQPHTRVYLCTQVQPQSCMAAHIGTHRYSRTVVHMCAQLQDTDTPSHLDIHTPVYPHTGTATGACTHVHAHLYVCTGMHSLTHGHTCEHARLCTPAQCVHVCIHMHAQPICAYIQTCTHLHMCTHRHTHKRTGTTPTSAPSAYLHTPQSHVHSHMGIYGSSCWGWAAVR